MSYVIKNRGQLLLSYMFHVTDDNEKSKTTRATLSYHIQGLLISRSRYMPICRNCRKLRKINDLYCFCGSRKAQMTQKSHFAHLFSPILSKFMKLLH